MWQKIKRFFKQPMNWVLISVTAIHYMLVERFPEHAIIIGLVVIGFWVLIFTINHFKLRRMHREFRANILNQRRHIIENFELTVDIDRLYQESNKSITIPDFIKLYREDKYKLIIETIYYRLGNYDQSATFVWDESMFKLVIQDDYIMVYRYAFDMMEGHPEGMLLDTYKMYKGRLFSDESDRIVNSIDDI